MAVRNDVEMKLRAFREALEADDSHPDAHAHFGNFLLQIGKDKEAVASLERAMELGSDDVRIFRSLAEAYTRTGDLTSAARCWQHVLAGTPSENDAQAALGLSLSMIALHSEALDLLERVASALPSSVNRAISVGVACYRAGNLRSARVAFEAATAIAPTSAEANYQLGLVLRAQGDREAARMRFEKSALLAPTDQQTQKALEEITVDVKQVEEPLVETLRDHSVFGGQLSAFPLPELLQFLDRQRASGLLVLQSSAGRGGFSFVGGALSGAAAPLLDHDASLSSRATLAIFEVLTWTQGQFAFYQRTTPSTDVETVGTQHALMEAIRLSDEIRR